jgi:CubicO group peptidase (beta-lactamase class C family)
LKVERIIAPDRGINGTCDPAFAPVAEAFEANFRTRDERGASLCVISGGRTVVDLWGGTAVTDTGMPWERDTVSVVFSCTKAATALCAHILIDRGMLDPQAQVARYWPEFGRSGKHDITVGMLLNHTSGIPAFRERLGKGDFYDWDTMISRIVEEEPFWAPGRRVGYQMMNFGWSVGELVRRVSGRSLGAFFREEIARPLGLDFHIGAPEDVEKRITPVSTFVPAGDSIRSPFAEAIMKDGTPVPRLAFLNTGRYDPNSRAAHAAELGGMGGIANARALARMFAGVETLLSRRRIDAMRQVSSSSECDETLRIPTRFGQGFMLAMDNSGLPPGNGFRIGQGAYGHVGIGGSTGFSDPGAGLAFGYTMNRLGGGVLLNERGQSLVDAAYDCLK